MHFTSRSFVLGALASIGMLACNDEPLPPAAPANPVPVATASAPPPAPLASAPIDASPPAAPPEPAKPKAWTYEGDEGPLHWGDLEPGFALCKTGTKQTPIDLPAKPEAAKGITLAAPTYAKVPLQIVHTGHTVVVNDTAASSFVANGTKYALTQFHFHTPSEHTIAGESFPAELHLVHKSAEGKLLVVAIMMRKGKENVTLAPLFANLPTEKTTEPRVVSGAAIDVGALLPKKPRYAHYDGSLTIPPCSEDVSWFIVEPDAKGGAELSGEQITKITAATHGPSNRPVQPLNSRPVVEVGSK